MKGCSASGIDRPIEIGKIQRFLVEYGWETGFDAIQKKGFGKGRIAVIGSGPAGLACAAELAKNGYGITIFEGREEAGGVLRYGVPKFRMNTEFVERELEDVFALGVELKTSARIERGGADRLLSEGFEAVFIGTGTWSPARLDIPGSGLVLSRFAEVPRGYEIGKGHRTGIKDTWQERCGGGRRFRCHGCSHDLCHPGGEQGLCHIPPQPKGDAR